MERLQCQEGLGVPSEATCSDTPCPPSSSEPLPGTLWASGSSGPGGKDPSHCWQGTWAGKPRQPVPTAYQCRGPGSQNSSPKGMLQHVQTSPVGWMDGCGRGGMWGGRLIRCGWQEMLLTLTLK